MVFNTKRIYDSLLRNFPGGAKQMRSKVLFVGKKMWQPSGHCARQNWNEVRSLDTVNESKIIILVLNYVTILVYTKTIIHLSVGG